MTRLLLLWLRWGVFRLRSERAPLGRPSILGNNLEAVSDLPSRSQSDVHVRSEHPCVTSNSDYPGDAPTGFTLPLSGNLQ